MMLVAWAGAALFAVALMAFARLYVNTLAHPAPDGAPVLGAVVVNVALFTVFAVHHSLLARSGARRLVSRLVTPAFERTAYVWVASLLFLAVCLLWQPLPGLVWQAHGPWRWGGYLVQVAGLVLVLAASRRIDVWELAGIRQATADTPRAGARANRTPPESLEVAGPFRWVRHPIYLGWVLFVFGVPVMTAGRLLFAAVSTTYLVLAIPFEERSLEATFGPAYADYRARVRWRLVPGLW